MLLPPVVFPQVSLKANLRYCARMKDRAIPWRRVMEQASNDFKASVMFGLMSPTSREPLRRETAWVYSQGAPPVFKGDLYYFSVDHDLRATARDIDTSRVAVYLLTGEYDWAATPAMSRELAEQIPGAFYRTMEGLGHFPMSEDPEWFLHYVRPVLDEIARGSLAR